MNNPSQIIIKLYLAHGTAKASGFKKYQRKLITDKASHLIWLPKSQYLVLDHGVDKAWHWKEQVIQLSWELAKKKGLI
jgi:hypothetical protein